MSLRTHLRLCFSATLLLLTVLPCPVTAQQRDLRDFLGLGTPPDKAAAKLGEPLYKQHCSACHGEDARGAQGPNLLRSTVVLHDEKGSDIGQVVRNGRPEGGMPAFPKLTDQEVYDIAEHIHLQVELAANRGLYSTVYANQRSHTSGDPAKGKSFFDSNCSNCHSAGGDLAKVGTKFPQAAVMQARFIWPVSSDPRHATVTTASGETVAGSIEKLSDFDVKLRDANGVSHDWPRDQVQVHVDDKLSGHRALLPKYTDADLHNLTAYLLELK